MDSQGKALITTVLIVAGMFLSTIALLVTLNRRDQLVGLNKEIQYADFAFSITDIRKLKALGQGRDESIASGNYYLVTLRIANHAKRVDYSFHNDVAILVDRSGREFRVSEDGQRALEATGGNYECDRPIPAGSSCATRVVFDLPPDSTPSHLRISAGPVGDLLEFIFFGNKRIDLRSTIN